MFGFTNWLFHLCPCPARLVSLGGNGDELKAESSAFDKSSVLKKSSSHTADLVRAPTVKIV